MFSLQTKFGPGHTLRRCNEKIFIFTVIRSDSFKLIIAMLVCENNLSYILFVIILRLNNVNDNNNVPVKFDTYCYKLAKTNTQSHKKINFNIVFGWYLVRPQTCNDN